MSATFCRFSCLFLSVCVLSGCGGGSDSASTSTDTQAPAAAPAAPSTPSAGGGHSATPAAATGPRTAPNTPEGTVREALQAVKDNQLERLWDLLPAETQTGINDLFKEFGNQVDAELWDKSFNLLSRYMSVLISKEEMVYQTPEVQAQFTQMETMFIQLGVENTDWLTQEKVRTLAKPWYGFATKLLNSELSSSKKLKSFDGRVFFAKTVTPMIGDLREFGEVFVEEVSQIEELKSSYQVQMMLQQADFGKLFDNVKVSKKSQEGDVAVVVIEGMGPAPQELKLVQVDGKWVPEMMLDLPQMLGMAKMMVPMAAGQVNAQKVRVMPALEQFEPLVDALQKAKTQDEFNVAYMNFNTQAPQLIASAMGMPGLSAMMGGGLVQVSPVTIEFQGEVADDQLGETIRQLEALTDDPEKAISLPKRDFGRVLLEITPVRDPQAFAQSINFAKRAEYDSARKTIVLELEPPPAPPETPATGESQDK